MLMLEEPKLLSTRNAAPLATENGHSLKRKEKIVKLFTKSGDGCT